MALRRGLRLLLRPGCNRGMCAVAPPKPTIGISAKELLSDAEIQSLLASHNKKSSDKVSDDATLRLSLLARLAERTGRPVASDAFGSLHSVADMATWFAKQLRPSGAQPHARSMIREAIGGEDQEAIDMRIDMDREHIQEEFMETLPGNLQLDPKMFKKPQEIGVRQRKRPKSHIAEKVRDYGQ